MKPFEYMLPPHIKLNRQTSHSFGFKPLYTLVVLAALQSVFPQTELGTFMSLVKRDKERQLQELTMIVTGIRLFNKECGKGGEGIDDCKFW